MASHQPHVSPRISFSHDFADQDEARSSHGSTDSTSTTTDSEDFEFIVLSAGSCNKNKMMAADELFFQGRMLCLDQIHKMPISEEEAGKKEKDLEIHPKLEANKIEGGRLYVDDDPSPRPPKCAGGRWKEFLRLKKQQVPPPRKPKSNESIKQLHDQEPPKSKDVVMNILKDASSDHQTPESPEKKLKVKIKRSENLKVALERSSSNPDQLLSSLMVRKKAEKSGSDHECKSTRCSTFNGKLGGVIDRSRSVSMKVSPVLNVIPMNSSPPLFAQKKQTINVSRTVRFTSTLLGGNVHVLVDDRVIKG